MITTAEKSSACSEPNNGDGDDAARVVAAGVAASAVAGKVATSMASTSKMAGATKSYLDPASASTADKINSDVGGDHGHDSVEDVQDYIVTKYESKRPFRSSQVATEFVGGWGGTKRTTTSVGPPRTAEEGRRKTNEGLTRKLVGWRTLPHKNTVRRRGWGYKYKLHEKIKVKSVVFQ